MSGGFRLFVRKGSADLLPELNCLPRIILSTKRG